MDRTPLYSLVNVRRCFGERQVLHIPSLTLEKDKIYALMGPNGSGKTTLMRLLAFMDAPTEGDIIFEGRKVNPDQRAQYRAHVVWVPQTPVLFTGSLLYNVEYPMRLKGVPRKQRRARAGELLESVGLAHLAEAAARRLSGGEAQRGSIARALAAGAKVILFDEPTANVDYRSREEIMRIIRALRQERGLSLMVTTHDQALADALAHERITLFEGELTARKSVDPDLTGPGREAAAVRVRLRLQDGRMCAILERVDTAASGPGPDFGLGSDPGLGGGRAIIRSLAEGEGGKVLLGVRGADGSRLDLVAGAGEDAALARGLLLGTELLLAPGS